MQNANISEPGTVLPRPVSLAKCQVDQGPFSGVREGRRGIVNRGSCCRWREGYFHTGKKSHDRHRVAKNSHAESLMVLGVIVDVRGRGVLEFAQVAERRKGATDLKDLEPIQGVRMLWKAVDRLRTSPEVKK